MMGRRIMQTDRRMPEAAPRVADAPPDNWVDRHAPAGWRPWLRMSRADRPIGTWLLLLPCWWGIGLAMLADRPTWRDLWIALACTLGAAVMRGAGCTWNDITDRDFDAQVARTRSRPLPSGQVTVRGALLWLVAQALAGLVILLTLGATAIGLGIASLALVAVYPFAKRFTWWPQLFLGLAFNWGVLLAWAAHAGNLAPAPVLAYLAGICWTVFYDTIYAHQDSEDDALIGVKSTARLFGARTPQWLAGFGLGAVLLLALAVLATGAQGLGLALGLLGVAGFGAHLGWQWSRLDIADSAACLRLFRSNRDAGLLFALFLALAAVA
ncbi:4-hydroxybenzoate octaprenyltransferase [Paracoccus sp. SMMA_5_TC]|nr:MULTISPECIES: 4-hydroxybenzoate octaprenyltransferase [unclassified Paracoccus (in: a-proteobacteria)]UXU76269.1 4-hydroxybenzoate octaprenyltransferase [Paracoccus sp. SMMA_5]UXU82156.1 4-hydroxybenzoate octaprenyltransferase [Paracoccus sp. SMMA_5_TC]